MIFSKFSRRLLLSNIGLVLSINAFPQKVVDHSVEFWPQYYVHVPVDSTWSVSADYSDRYNDFSNKIQWIGRVGANYQLNKRFLFSAGYAYSEYFTASGVRREHRPWQQLAAVQRYRFFRFSHRLRLEERFQKDARAERYNHRLRYQFQVQMPIMKKQKAYIFVADEPMINLGKELKGVNKFDQNRFQFGAQFKLYRDLYISPAYQSTYQIQSNKVDFKRLDIWRIGITYRWE